MNWKDIFRFRRKNLMIEAPKQEYKQKEVNNSANSEVFQSTNQQKSTDIQIFAHKSEQEGMQYSYRMLIEGNSVNLATVQGEKDISLKQIKKDLETAINHVSGANNPLVLERKKKETIESLKKISETNPYVIIDESAIDVINEYQPNNILNYDTIEGLKKTISPNALTPEKAKLYGEQLQQRLDYLNTIKTSEDAYKDRENLTYFMRQKEDVPQSALIDANIQSLEDGDPLDENTVMRIAKNMKTLDLNNEDGALYSVYLKIEEKRIWKRIKDEIYNYFNESQQENTPDLKQEIFDLIGELDSFILKTKNGGFSYEILDYIISDMKEKNIEHYTKRKSDKPSIREDDEKLAIIINSKLDLPHKKDILTFLYTRIGSLGQLSYKSSLKSHREVFRELVANTDFKDADYSESKEFLLLVSKVEKNYVEEKFKEISEIQFAKVMEENDFKKRIDVGYTPKVNPDIVNNSKAKTKDNLILQ